MSLTTVDQGLLGTYAQYTGFKNRIINGAMQIDQRNAGAAVSLTNGNVAYPVDRTFVENNSGTGVLSIQQVSDAPTGFTKSLKVTVTTNDTSLGSSDRTYVNQRIEGYNIADLAFGLATAKTITISFWVKSSLTGTFGGVLLNGAGSRSYPYTYAISSANTWEYKTITIPGDNTGTWTTDNTSGMQLLWGLGVGSTLSGTPNVWSSTVYLSAIGAVDLTATLNATWQVTGVQLEKGSTATSFDYRPYGTELALCQRYYYRMNAEAIYRLYGVGCVDATNSAASVYIPLPVTMRAAPTASALNTALQINGSVTAQSPTFQTYTTGFMYVPNTFVGTTGQAFRLLSNNTTTGYIDASAEL